VQPALPARLIKAPENFISHEAIALVRQESRAGRRDFLRTAFAAAVAASAGMSAQAQGSAGGDPNILELPAHSKGLGQPVATDGYGKPSKHEANVQRRIWKTYRRESTVIHPPVAVENFLVDAFHTLEQRYAENDAADDLGLRPDELYLSADELRSEIDRMQRVEVRALGRTATKIDQEIALDAETPKISVGKERAKRKPLFLFPATHWEPRLEAGLVPPGRTSAASKQDEGLGEIAWQAQSVMRYHGRLPDLARDLIERRKSGSTTLFVMPSSGVAERVTEILRDYDRQRARGNHGIASTSN